MRIPIAALLVGFLVLSTAGFATAQESYSLTVENSISTPEQEVTYEGNTYTVTDISAVDPGETIQTSVSAPTNENFVLQLRDSDLNIVDFQQGSGNSDVSISTNGLEPGSYVLALEIDGTIENIQPVVVSGYSVSVSHPETVATDETLSVTIDVQSATQSQSPDKIEIGLHNDKKTVREVATATGSGTYEAKVQPDSLAEGEYKLHAVAIIDEETSHGFPSVYGIGNGNSVSVTEVDDNTENGDSSSGDTGNSSGDGDDGSGTETDPTEEISVPNVSAEAAAAINSNETESRVTFGNTSVRAISWQNQTATGIVQVADLSRFKSNMTVPVGATVSRMYFQVPEALQTSSATITSTLEQRALTERDINMTDLRMVRYLESSNNWESLTTNATDRDGEITLSTKTPGFSYFAITAVGEPTADFSLSAKSLTVGESVALNASSSFDKYGDITSYHWAIGNETYTGATVRTAFDKSGKYPIKLTVTNSANKSDTTTTQLLVETDSKVGDDTGDGTGDDSEGGSESPADDNGDTKGTGAEGDDDSTDADSNGPGFTLAAAFVALFAAGVLARWWSL